MFNLFRNKDEQSEFQNVSEFGTAEHNDRFKKDKQYLNEMRELYEYYGNDNDQD